MGMRAFWVALAMCVAAPACKKSEPARAAEKAPVGIRIGIVTDIGGRGDHSFNDSALRGLEVWAAGKSESEVTATLPKDLLAKGIKPLGVTPLVVQSKAQEDYEPNLELLVEQKADLIVGVGYMLENAVETIARRNTGSHFLLIDSPVLTPAGEATTLPNVRSVVFKEEEGSFLVGALAGKVTKGRVGFVGGTQTPLIQRFEAGFRAGMKATRPDAVILASYTGSFDNVAAGKQLAQDLLSKNVDVIFHAAGADGLGVIQAVKEARAAGKPVFAIGVDSDQSALAPEAVLTSMVKRVDLAVFETTRDVVAGKFSSGDMKLGLKEGGVGYAEVRLDFPGKEQALAEVEALRQRIVDGQLEVPSTVAP